MVTEEDPHQKWSWKRTPRSGHERGLPEVVTEEDPQKWSWKRTPPPPPPPQGPDQLRSTAGQAAVCLRKRLTCLINFCGVSDTKQMFVTHLLVIIAHQILALVTNMRSHDLSALADWSPKPTMSCTACTYIQLVTCMNQPQFLSY